MYNIDVSDILSARQKEALCMLATELRMEVVRPMVFRHTYVENNEKHSCLFYPTRYGLSRLTQDNYKILLDEAERKLSALQESYDLLRSENAKLKRSINDYDKKTLYKVIGIVKQYASDTEIVKQLKKYLNL